MTRAPKYHLTSYGCQMNKLDAELVESRLLAAGYEAAATDAEADVVLLNTCSVRQHAEDRVWSRLGVLRARKRQEPRLVIGVLGCMAQEHKRAMLARMPHVDLVVGPSAFGDIDQKVESARRRNEDLAADRPLGAGLLAVDQGVSGDAIVRNPRTRSHRSQAYVSVMRGCNMPCSYCIVPTTRGDEVSRPIETIVDEVQRLCDDGVTEITLLGQTVNAYGRDLGRDVTLARLLRRLHDLAPLRRIGFITSHPNFLSAELIDALAELPRLMRYLHLPAQSGSDTMLRAMRRGYTVERYLRRIDALREKAPDFALHSDFIVGYPGETAADLAATIDLMERVRFAQSYVFKYSPRPGTLSAEQPDDVPEAIKAERNQALLEVQERHTAAMMAPLAGRVVEVLVEGESKVAGRVTGRDLWHRLVHFPATDRTQPGCYLPIRVREILGHSMLGEVLAEDYSDQPIGVTA
ncbi:MAG: tRNA (N6-isopentenyl adenosine(37)-C2)-methylthiotransferase MiaB [Planctomycetota bacterium]